MIVIKSLVAIIWAVVGLVLWIPITSRTAIVFIFSVFHATTVGDQVNPKNHVLSLTAIWGIYQSGFNAIFSKHVSTTNTDRPKMELWKEVLWALVFWGSFILLYFYLKYPFPL